MSPKAVKTVAETATEPKAPKAKTLNEKLGKAVKASPKAKEAKGKEKAEAKPRAKKEGLRPAQVKILQLLSKAPKGLTKKAMVEQGGMEPTSLGCYLGLRDDEQRKALEEKTGRVALIDLKLIKEEVDDELGYVYFITPAGKEKMKEMDKAQKETEKAEAKKAKAKKE